MADQKTQLIISAQDFAPSPPSDRLLSNGKPRTAYSNGWLRLRQSAHKLWILEALASILSLLIFVTIVGVLLWYNDRIYGASTTQTDEMKRPHIFFYLAFLSAIMRATMLLPVATAIGQLKWSWFRSSQRLIDIERFDDAAGGVLGSVRLMFTLRFRHVAVVGAALTILALPLDALVQTAVFLPSRLETVNELNRQSQNFGRYRNETSLERSLTYNKYQLSTEGEDYWPETSMINALQFGQGYSNGPGEFMSATTKIDCPTGYCDFNKTQTLSIGHYCMRRKDVSYWPGGNGKAPYLWLPGTNVVFYLKGYKNLTDQTVVKDQRISAIAYKEWPDKTRSYEKSMFARELGPLIVRTSMLLDLGNGTDKTIDNGTIGIDCALFWEIKTAKMYVNATSNFLLGEDRDVSIKYNYTLNTYPIQLAPQKCIVDGREVPVTNDTYYTNNCRYQVAKGPHIGLQNLLTDEELGLRGTMLLLESSKNGTSKWTRRNLFTINASKSSWNRTADDAFRQIDTMWKNIALLSSYTLRRAESSQFGEAGQADVKLYLTGRVSALVVFYKVKWTRLAMPAFIVLCCALFVLYTALVTRKEYAWRRSALPLLFHGLEDQKRLAQGDVRDFNVMQDIAKEMRVRLTEHVDANGARFTTQN